MKTIMVMVGYCNPEDFDKLRKNVMKYDTIEDVIIGNAVTNRDEVMLSIPDPDIYSNIANCLNITLEYFNEHVRLYHIEDFDRLVLINAMDKEIDVYPVYDKLIAKAVENQAKVIVVDDSISIETGLYKDANILKVSTIDEMLDIIYPMRNYKPFDPSCLPIVDTVKMDELLEHAKSICNKGTKVINKVTSRHYKLIQLVTDIYGDIDVYLEDTDNKGMELLPLSVYLSRECGNSTDWTFIEDNEEENKIIFPWDDESTEMNDFGKKFFKEVLKVDDLLYYQKTLLASMWRTAKKDV